MGSPYQSQSASGFNASPPPDDGSTVAANKITWGTTIKAKLADPIKALADAINTALRTALNVTPSTTSIAYTTLVGDHLTTIETTGTFTISLGDAATMIAQTMGYTVTVMNKGTGIITCGVITAANTLNGTANGTMTLPPNCAATFTVNQAGNGYYLVASAEKGLNFIASFSASASATIDFTSGITAAYDEYLVTMTDVIPATDNTDLWMRISVAGVFKSGVSDYHHARIGIIDSSATPFGVVDVADAQIVIAATLGSGTGEALSGEVRIFNPAGTAVYKNTKWSVGYFAAAPGTVSLSGAGNYTGGIEAIDGLRFMMSSGNIASGRFALYGVRKS